MEIVLALLIVAVLAVFVAAPLRRGAEQGDARLEAPEVADLEARKEALYRQIRDAELDREQGKISQADWEPLDAELRREAIAVLRRLDELRS